MSYLDEFLFADRMWDLLAMAAGTGRLTDEEIEYVEHALTWEAHYLHLSLEQSVYSQRLLEEDIAKSKRDVGRRAGEYEKRMVKVIADHQRRKALELAGKLCPHIEPEAYAAWRRAQGAAA